MTHACYLLRSLNPRFKSSFYIGCTTDPRRRLRQHNGEVAQGAQFTKKKRPWEMVLCVYGFTSHVNALQFEWAWQHPLVSIAVKEAAAKLSLKGVPSMIKLVCTMVTLPKWNSLNLSLQFMLSSLLQHRQGSPPLPPQMRLFVAPIHSLPGKDTGDDNDNDDDLSTCPDDLSQNGQLDEDSGLEASSSAVDVEVTLTEGGLTAELYTTHDITSSPCPKTKGKKSRKGKTPQGRKGKRGGNHKLLEDTFLIDLQIEGSGPRSCFAGEEMSAAERRKLIDCDGFGDLRITPTTGETMCTSIASQEERMYCYANSADLSYLSVGEKTPFCMDYEDDSNGSLEIDFYESGTKTGANDGSHSGSQENRAGSDECVKADLMNRSFGEKIPLHGALKVQSSCFENRASEVESNTSEATPVSQTSRGQRTDSYAVSEDLSCWSISATILSKGLVKDYHSERPVVNDVGRLSASRITKAVTQVECIGYSEGENIGSHTVPEEHNVSRYLEDRKEIANCYGVSEDPSSKSVGDRILSDGPLEDGSQISVAQSSLLRDGDSAAKSAIQESEAGDSDIEEISVEEFQTAEGQRKGFAVPSTRSTEGDARRVISSISDYDTVQIIVGEKNPLEFRSVNGVELQQRSLTTFFPGRKQGAVPTSIYRKSRKGEICKVLEDHSNTRNAPKGVDCEGKLSGILPDSKGSCRERTQDAPLIIDSDDDEIHEISVTEFEQSTFVGNRVTARRERLCSLSKFR